MNYTGLVATWMSWAVQAVGGNVFTEADQAAIEQAVLDQCDGLDGAADGLISDPRLCPAIDFSNLGLSNEKKAALNKLYEQRPFNSAGDILYEGVLPYGSEIYWPIWLPGAAANAVFPQLNLIFPFNDGFLKYMAFEVDDPTFTALDFDFDTDPERLDFMGRIYNATTDLDAYKKGGGKILMYHGWADTIVPPIYSQHYYDQVADAMGGVKRIQRFFRLFMIPGMDHCSTAQGFGYFDWIGRFRRPDGPRNVGRTGPGTGQPGGQWIYPRRGSDFPSPLSVSVRRISR